MARCRGLDFSAAQGLVDFDKLPPWVRFLVVKVTEGETWTDATFLRNIREARRRGIIVFVYHFFRSSQDALKQIAHLEAVLDSIEGPLPLVIFLDFESKADALTAEQAAAKYVDAWRAAKKVVFLVGTYLYPDFEKNIMHHALAAYPELADGPLWMADYSGGENPPEGWHPYTPAPWTNWHFAQTSGNNSSLVDGVPGHVDHNVFNGTEEELRAWLGLDGKGETDTVVPAPVDFPERDYSDGPT